MENNGKVPGSSHNRWPCTQGRVDETRLCAPAALPAASKTGGVLWGNRVGQSGKSVVRGSLMGVMGTLWPGLGG